MLVYSECSLPCPDLDIETIFMVVLLKFIYLCVFLLEIIAATYKKKGKCPYIYEKLWFAYIRSPQ